MKKKLCPLAPARALVTALFVSITAHAAFAQTASNAAPTATPAAKEAPAKVDDKAEQVVARAVEALGGASFLGVRSITSRGYYTPYEQGVARVPVTFVNYLVFPDRERTEFKGSGVRSIQTYAGETGWIFDGMVKKIKDLTPEQVEDFRFAMRTSLDNLLRGWWREKGARLSYVGRREAGVGMRNEVVRLTYEDGFAVEYEFSARDGVPAKVRYKRKNKEGEDVEEEERYAQYLSVNGVGFAHIQDRYSAGLQSSRVNYEKVELNAPVPESLFAKPADVKSLK
ncbi:MAG TPA: hypothetical protein VF064_17385 [Pyrinomonadaceae bacterium]